jgi:hypothetical protein
MPLPNQFPTNFTQMQDIPILQLNPRPNDPRGLRPPLKRSRTLSAFHEFGKPPTGI